MKKKEIRSFAKHYAIPLPLATDVCTAGGNWARAFNLLVSRVKQLAGLPDANHQPLSQDDARQIVANVKF